MKQETVQFGAGAAAVVGVQDGPVGIFVDGENLQAWAAGPIAQITAGAPPARLRRVYGNIDHLRDWTGVAAFEVIHTGVSGSGPGEAVKNAADIRIAVDVMEFVLAGQGQTVILCSSDRDFTPLVWALRRYGRVVIGVGEAKTSAGFRAACHLFHTICPPRAMPTNAAPAIPKLSESVAARVRKELAPYIGNTQGMPLKAFGSAMSQRQKVCVRDLGYKTWRDFAEKNPAICTLLGEGDAARVKLAQAAK